MQRFQDGTWKFDDTGPVYRNVQVGTVKGWVIVNDGEIDEVWAETGEGVYTLTAPGSWFHNALVAGLKQDLPAYIAYQASSKRHWREAAEFQNAKTLAVTP
jgi:hypothetical protein